MARPKKNSEPKGKPFWNPAKAGEKIRGRFMYFRECVYNKGTKKERPGIVMVLDTFQVSMSYAIVQLFQPVYRKMKTGDKVELTFDGKVKTKSKRTVKKFTAMLNGDALEPVSMFSDKPAPRKALVDFFSRSQD